MTYCIMCDGPMEFIGLLGQTAHYRCRDCGIGGSTSAYDAFGAEVEAETGCEPGEMEGML